jgi:hypothetical protein
MDIETSTCISVEHLQLLQSLSETYTMPIRTIVSSMISFAAESNTWSCINISGMQKNAINFLRH